MARSAGGIISVAVILGVVTAYLIWKVERDNAKMNVKNWQGIVVSTVEIPSRTKITREMLKIENYPPNLIPEGHYTTMDQVTDRFTQNRINVQARIRPADLLQPGQSPMLSVRVPEGMRGVTIGGDEIRFVGGSVQVGDHVDIIASYFDPRNKQDVTRMILQNVRVLMTNRGDDPNAKGALSSMTMAVRPEQTELLKAAERSGTMSVSLRSISDSNIVQTAGYTPQLLVGAPQDDESITPIFTNIISNVKSTPVTIIVPPPAYRPPKEIDIKVTRGVSDGQSYNVAHDANKDGDSTNNSQMLERKN